MAFYGPPQYDVSRKATYNKRVHDQARKKRPAAMYSSHWHDFGREVLRGDPVIKRKLRTLATRGLFSLRRRIPLGDAEKGHIRNDLRVTFHKRGGIRRDRMTFTVDYRGENVGGWVGALRRSSYPSAEAYKSALRTAKMMEKPVSWGPKKNWVQETARELGGA